MPTPTTLQEASALVQQDLPDKVAKLKPTKARTAQSTIKGGRKMQGQLAGIRIPFLRNLGHGQTWPSPVTGDYNYKGSLPEEFSAMFAAPVSRVMNMTMEKNHLRDMERGKIPLSYIDERERRIGVHMLKLNWGFIGKGDNGVAEVLSAAVATVTCKLVNTARGQSKGSLRVFTSTAAKPLYYDGVNPATNTVVATFWSDTKPAPNTFTVGGFTVGNIAALNVAGLRICESGSWMREIMGYGGHIDDTTRIWQGANTGDDPGLNAKSIDAGNSTPTPTMIRDGKNVLTTRSNMDDEEYNLICRLTFINWYILAAYGYGDRQYQAAKGEANITFGLPNMYQDQDTLFIPDPNYEEGFIDLHKKRPFMMYEQKTFSKSVTDGVGRHEYGGAGSGSSIVYENYDENIQLVCDLRGPDAKDPQDGGSPNPAVFIKNIAISATQNEATLSFGNS